MHISLFQRSTAGRVRPRRGVIAAAAMVVAAGIGLSACGTGASAAAVHPSSNTGAAAAGAAAPTAMGLTSAQDTSPRRPNPYQYLPKVPSFQLLSKTVQNGKALPLAQFSKLFGVPGGQDESPELSWSGFPANTKSFVVSMYDPQAPTGSGFWHWVVVDVPGTTTYLPLGAGAPGGSALPKGAVQLAGDAGAHQFVGAAPPPGSGIHDYYITVTALDVATAGVPDTASAAYTGFAIDSHTIARATIICPTPAAG